MYFLHQPPEARIAEFISTVHGDSFSYADVGATRGTPPRGFVVDHNRVRVGTGEQCFQRARNALSRWKMFELGWVELCWPDAPIEPDTTVAVLAHALRIWSLNACRIVYRIGFAYGTLPDHAESGEERFSVEWHRGDDSVWYDILAFSRPNHWTTKLARSFTRGLQRRFARDSLAAMQRAVLTHES
jgi:uncharacterized protein (UPF0548 family)